MKKKTKIIITVVLAVLVVSLLALYLVPMFLLREATRKVLPEATRAEYITDFEIKRENTTEVDNGSYTIQVPGDLLKQEVNEDVKVNSYASENEETKILMLTEAFSEEMTLLNPEDYENDPTMKRFGIKNVEKMFESLGYARPDSYYNILKGICLLDWNDYNMLSIRKSVAFSIYAYLRTELTMNAENYLYERDDVRAIIQKGKEPNIHIDLFCTDDLNGAYTILVHGEDMTLEEVTAMLNTVEFK